MLNSILTEMRNDYSDTLKKFHDKQLISRNHASQGQDGDPEFIAIQDISLTFTFASNCYTF